MFLNSYPEIKANFSYTANNVDTLLSEYYNNKKVFDKLMKLVTITL